MSDILGRFEVPSVNRYGAQRVDDERVTPLAYTLFTDSMRNGFIDDVISDKAMDTVNEAHGMGNTAMFVGTNYANSFLSDNDKAVLATGLKPKIAQEFLAATTGADYQRVMEKDPTIQRRMLKVSLAIGIAHSAANTALGVMDTLAETRLGDTDEGREKAIKASYAIASGIMFGEDSMNSLANDLGVNLDSTDTPEDTLISSLATAALSPEGYGGDISKDQIKNRGIMGAISDDVITNYRAVFGVRNANPYLNSRDIRLTENGIVVNATEIETAVTEELVSSFDSKMGAVGLAAADLITSLAAGKKELVSETDSYTSKMRLGLINESMTVGDYGNAGMWGLALGMAGATVEYMLIGMVTGFVAGLIGGPKGAIVGGVAGGVTGAGKGVNAAWKGYKAVRIARKLATSKALVQSTNVALKTWAQANNETGYGFAKARTLGDAKLTRNMAYDTATMYLSMGVSERLALRLGAGHFVKQAARSKAAGDLGGFYRNLAYHNIGGAGLDLGIDMAIDVAAHTAIEQAYGRLGGTWDPLLPSQEAMTSLGIKSLGLGGETSATVGGLGTQLAARFAARVGGRQISRIATWGKSSAPASDPYAVGSKLWRQDIESTMFKGEKSGASIFHKLTTNIFNDNLTNVSSIARELAPDRGNRALWEMLETSSDPYKAYAALWKLQEIQTNRAYSHIRTLVTGQRDSSIIGAAENVLRTYTKDPGIYQAGEFFNLASDATVLSIKDKKQFDTLSDRAVNYIINGESNSPADMTQRFREVLSFISTKTIIDEDSVFAGSGRTGSSLIANLQQKVGEKIRASTDDNTTNSLRNFLNDFSSGVKTDTKGVDILNVSRAMFSDTELAKTAMFALDEKNTQRLNDILKETAINTQNRVASQKAYLNEEIADAQKAYDNPGTSTAEKKRLEYVLKELTSFREILGYDPDSDKAIKGIDIVVDFFKTLTKGTDVPIRDINDLITREPMSGVSTAVDYIGAAQAYAKLYSSTITEFLGDATASRIKGYSENEVINFVNQRLVPLVNVYDAFYESMDDNTRAEARSIMKSVYGALNSRSDNSSKAISKLVDNQIRVLDATETAIASHRDMLNTISILDGINNYITVREQLGDNADALTRLGVLISSTRPEDAGIEIRDTQGRLINENLYPTYTNMFAELVEDDIDIASKIELNKNLLSLAAARQVSIEYLNNPKLTPEQAVDKANAELTRLGLGAKVSSLSLGEAGSNPRIVVDTADAPLNNRDILEQITNIHEVFARSSAAQLNSRSRMAEYDAVYSRTTYTYQDGTNVPVQTLRDRLSKDVPNILPAVRGIVTGYLSGNGDDTLIGPGITSSVLSYLWGTKFAVTLSKLDTDQQAAFAWNIAKLGAGAISPEFEYDIKGGSYVLKMGTSTMPVVAASRHFTIVDGKAATIEQDRELQSRGFVAANSGAGAGRIYVELSPAFREHNLEVIIKSLTDTYREMAEGYDDLDGRHNTFAYNAWQAMLDIDARRTTTLSSNPATAYGDIISGIVKAFDASAISRSDMRELGDLADYARYRSVIDVNTGTETIKLDVREAISDYINKGAPGTTEAIGQQIATVRTLMDTISGSDGTWVDMASQAMELIRSLPDTATRLSSDSQDFIDQLSSLDSQEIATKMRDIEGLGNKITGMLAELENSLMRDRDSASRLSAVKEYALGNMTSTERVNFLETVFANRLRDTGVTVSRDELIQAVRKADEADMYNAIRKTAFTAIGSDESVIQAMKSKDPNKALANIITITMTRGSVLGFTAPELSKRASANMIGRSISKGEAVSLWNGLAKSVAAKQAAGHYGDGVSRGYDALKGMGVSRPLTLRVVISKLPDGDNQMPPELIRALGSHYGIEADGSFKTILDVYGSIGKTVYAANSSLIDAENNIITVRIGIDNLKRLSAAGAAWATDVINSGESGVHLRTAEEISSFISAHSLQSGTYAITKPVGGSSQTDSSLFLRYALADRIKTGSTSLRSLGSEALGVKDAYFQAFRELDKTSYGTGYVYTATAINDLDNNTGKYTILSDNTMSRFSPTMENVRAGGGLLPTPRMEVGIKLLADLVTDTVSRRSVPSDVQAVLDAVYDAHNKQIDLIPEQMARSTDVLLRYLSDPNAHKGGQHVFRSTIDGEEAYFIGVTRSPTPRETQPMMPLTAILNTRENGVRLNDAGQKLVGGDFDGDLALGLAPIRVESLIKAASLATYGTSSSTYLNRVRENLGDHLLSLTASSIEKNKLYSHFVSSLTPSKRLTPASALDSNEYLAKGTQALSGAIQSLTYAKAILHAVYTNSDSMRLRTDFKKTVTEISQKLASKYLQQNVEGGVYDDAFQVNLRSNIGEDTRLVFIDPSSSSDVTRDSMVEFGAIGSVRYIASEDGGNTGADGARRSIAVTEVTPDNRDIAKKKYNVIVLETVPDKIGVLKVVGVPVLDPGVVYNKASVLNIAKGLSQQMKANQPPEIMELNKPMFAAVPQTILEAVNSALVDTNVQGQRIVMSKYKDNPSKFVEDIVSMTSEVYAASLVDIDVAIHSVSGGKGTVGYMLSDINTNRVDDSLRKNSAFMQESASGIVRELSGVIKDNLEKINRLNQMTEPDNKVPLAQQHEARQRFTSNSNDLPAGVYKLMSLDNNDGGIGWRDEFGFNRINTDTPMFKEIDKGLMSIRNPLSNLKKMNFYSDLSKVLKSFEVFTNRLYTTDKRELDRVTKSLEKSPLYIDSSRNVSRDTLANLVYDTLKAEGKPIDKRQISAILNDLGIKKGDPETWYAPKMASPAYVLGGGISKNKEDGTRVLVSVLTKPDGSALTMFDLNNSLTKVIESKHLLSPDKQRYGNDLRMVLNGMISLLSGDSQVRATAAAEGVGSKTIGYIRKMYAEGNITATATTGGYRVSLEGLVSKVKADDIEDTYVINKELDSLRIFSELGLVNEMTKKKVSDYLTKGEGDC